MNVRLSNGPRAEELPRASIDSVEWLPRARLRSGARADRALTGLALLTAGVLAAAAGVAAYSGHGKSASFQVETTEKMAERAPTIDPSPPPLAPVRAAIAPALPATPPRNAQAAPVFEAPPPAYAAATATAPVRALPDVAPAAPPPDHAAMAPVGERAPEPLSRKTPELASEPVAEPVPPIPLSTAAVTPPPRPAQLAQPARARDVAPDPVAASDPAPARTRAEAPAPAGGSVAIYLDEFPDQKAAAAGLSQKAGAYGPIIGSAGKLTYSRRNSNVWRLRVSNLDQAAAEALCGKMKGAGAPCTVGPN